MQFLIGAAHGGADQKSAPAREAAMERADARNIGLRWASADSYPPLLESR